MSMKRFLFVTAMPFHLADCHSNVSQIANNTISKLPSANNESKNHLSMTRLDERSNNVPENASVKLMRRKNRILRNRMSSQVSREKAKLRKELLEKQLLELQIEHMKILLDNENMERRQKELEEENILLRNRLENSTNSQSLKGESVANTLKQAAEVGVATSILNPNDNCSRDCEQAPVTEFSKPIDLENSSICNEKCVMKTSDIFNFSNIVENVQVAEFSKPINLENSLMCDDKCETSDIFNFSNIAENIINENSLKVHNDYNLCKDFDMIEKIIFGKSRNSFEHDQWNITNKKEMVSVDTSLFNSSEMEDKVMATPQSIPDFPPQWTFEDLYMDFKENAEFFQLA